MYTIYKYTNKHNGKVYVGQTSTTLKERAQSNGRNYRESRRFYEAIQKYGWDSFTSEILDHALTLEESHKLEKQYIAMYRSNEAEYGYNIQEGGYCGPEGESAEIISRKAVERYKDRTSNPMYGKKHTAETKLKISQANSGQNNAMYGSKWTEKQRLLCGTKGKKLNLSDEQREALRQKCLATIAHAGTKKVYCVEDDCYYDSVTEAACHYGVAKSTLSGHLNGAQHSCAGKHFVFINNT